MIHRAAYVLLLPLLAPAAATAQTTVKIDGATYEIHAAGLAEPVVKARVGAKLDGQWVYSTDYPQHKVEGQRIVHTGLTAKPDLVCSIVPSPDPHAVSIRLSVQNSTSKSISVQAVRLLDAIGEHPIQLGGPESVNRVYSDSSVRTVLWFGSTISAKDPAAFTWAAGRNLYSTDRVTRDLVFRGDVALECPGMATAGDDSVSVLDVIAGQLLAFFRCLAEGLKPDHPSDGNVISRVVNDFVIHRR